MAKEVVRDTFSESGLPFTYENCAASETEISGRIKDKFCIHSEDHNCLSFDKEADFDSLELTPLERKAFEKAAEVAEAYCRKRSKWYEETKEERPETAMEIEFRNGMAADYVGGGSRNLWLTVEMSKGLPAVYPAYIKGEMRPDGKKTLRVGSLFEFGSRLAKDRVAPNHYLREWAEKLELVLTANRHLFADEEYWETEGDRQVAEQVRAGVPFDQIRESPRLAAERRREVESVPEGAPVRVLDRRVARGRKEEALLQEILSREMRRLYSKIDKVQSKGGEGLGEGEVAELRGELDSALEDLDRLAEMSHRLSAPSI